MKRKFIVSIVAFLVASAAAFSQNVIDLIVAEAAPDSTQIDTYGRMSGWIEIYNTSLGTVNLGGCYLTDDRNDLKKSLIPTGYTVAKIGPRQSILFYGSGRGEDGLLYTDFTIERGETIYLVSNDGRTIVDSLVIPSTLPQGMSAQKLPVDNKGIKYYQDDKPADPTPGMRNGSQNAESGSQRMARTDPHGFILTIVAVTVVFSALAILWFLFWLLFERPAKMKANPKPAKVKKAKAGDSNAEVAAAIAMALDLDSNGDVYAAIATALHLYFNDAIHDNESFVVTIKQPSTNTGWNEKTQTFRRMPR